VIGDGSISVWDATTGWRLDSFDLPQGTLGWRSLSSDGRYAVTVRSEGEECQPLLWDVTARNCLHVLHVPSGDHLVSSTFAPGSSFFATWHQGKQTLIRLWDVSSGKLVRSFADKRAFAKLPRAY